MSRARLECVIRLMGLALLAALVMTMGRSAVAQRPGPAKEKAVRAAAESGAEKSATKPARQFRGRLPNYYGQVVDQQQRQQIYAIQREYFPQIEALEAKLAALIAERDAKIAAVLTPQQRAEVEQLQAEAKAKRAKKRAAQ